MKKVVIGIIIGVVAVLIVAGWFFTFVKFRCNDGTFHGGCSENKPYFCNDALVEKASVCGCPKNFTIEGEECFSEFNVGEKNVSLKYSFKDEEKEIDFVVYGEFYNYSKDISRFIDYDSGEQPSRRDFKLNIVDNEIQKEMLMPLVVGIQNLAKDKKEQVEIARSLVQNIPYDFVKANLSLWAQAVSTKYPYEVLYDNLGVCGEKSDLLVILLREIGYGTAIFYFPEKNHEGVGIKCSFFKDYRDSGYCYIETTSLSLINDVGILNSLGGSEVFEVIEISDGEGF